MIARVHRRRNVSWLFIFPPHLKDDSALEAPFKCGDANDLLSTLSAAALAGGVRRAAAPAGRLQAPPADRQSRAGAPAQAVIRQQKICGAARVIPAVDVSSTIGAFQETDQR